MSTHKDKEHYHNKGEKDGAKGHHDPPHQGPVFSKDWWGSDRGGRPVTDKNKRADYDAYEKGYDNAKKQKGGGGCFLTTACVEHAGLADNCHELQVLRRFRDNYVTALPNGKAILEEYYTSAPTIVRRIQSSQKRDDVLETLFGIVRETVALIEAGRHKQAFDSYATTFRKLKTQYGDA